MKPDPTTAHRNMNTMRDITIAFAAFGGMGGMIAYIVLMVIFNDFVDNGSFKFGGVILGTGSLFYGGMFVFGISPSKWISWVVVLPLFAIAAAGGVITAMADWDDKRSLKVEPGKCLSSSNTKQLLAILIFDLGYLAVMFGAWLVSWVLFVKIRKFNKSLGPRASFIAAFDAAGEIS